MNLKQDYYQNSSSKIFNSKSFPTGPGQSLFISEKGFIAL